MEDWVKAVYEEMEEEVKEIIESVPPPYRSRVLYSFINHNILTIEHLTNLTVQDVMKWRNFGSKSLNVLQNVLELKGYHNSIFLSSMRLRLESNPKMFSHRD